MTPLEWITAATARCDAETAYDSAHTPEYGWHVLADNYGVVAAWLTEDDAERIALALTDLPRALAALTAVLALHVPEWVVIDYVGGSVCAECREPVESEPCRTVRAITAALTEGETP